MIKRKICHFVFVLVGCFMLTGPIMAQRVNFGLYAKDDIVLTKIGSTDLNFNSKQTYILANQSISIDLNDNDAVVVSITGRLDQEITVTVDSPEWLYLDPAKKLPLLVKFAYSNTGATTLLNAKQSAIEMAGGFSTATFPIIRRLATSPLPTPPPTPAHQNNVIPTGTAYLFIYGVLTVPWDAAVGSYSGDISIHVSY